VTHDVVAGAPDRTLTDRAFRRLLADPRVLPSATTLRFAVLVLLLIATAGSAYGYIGLLTHRAAEKSVRACIAGTSITQAAQTSNVTNNAYLTCTGKYATSVATWTVIGIAVIILANLLVYALMPWWALRRLRPLDPDNALHREIAAEIGIHATRLGLATSPQIRFNAAAADTNGRVFGYQRRTFLQLNRGLLLAFRQDRQQFDAIVLHELAHIRNRDIRPSSIAVSAWRVFVVVVLLPFVAALIAPGLFDHPTTLRAVRIDWTLPAPHIIVSLAGLSALVFLTQRAVLRVRETHADAIAAAYDLEAMIATIRRRAEAGTGTRRPPTALSDHPTTAARLADVTDPRRLSAPDSMAMFSAGVATSIIMINGWFLSWVSGLSTWLTTGPLSVLLRGTPGKGNEPTIMLQVLLDGPAVLLALVIIVRICCASAWRTQLCVPFGGRRTSVWRLAGPLAIGLMLGEPTSVLYANAGFYGVFDTTPAREVLDYAASAAALLLVLLVLFQWAADAATVWIPVTVRSLRLACAIATVVACVGFAPVLFTWFLVHNNPTIVGLTFAGSPQLSTWFGHAWVFTSYEPSAYIVTLPGCALALGIPYVYFATGSLRRGSAAPMRWLPAGLEPAGPVLGASRPRNRVGFAAAIGLYAMACAAVAGIATMAVLNRHLGGPAVVASQKYGGISIVGGWTAWILISCCAIGIVVIMLRVRQARLTWALLTTFIAATWSTLVMPIPTFVAVCGTRAYSCAAAQAYIAKFDYGFFAATTPVTVAIDAVLIAGAVLLVLAIARAVLGVGGRHTRSRMPERPAARAPQRVAALRAQAVFLVLTVLISVAGVYAYYSFVFTIS
jgi:Zn-dependent protease with chaperone function